MKHIILNRIEKIKKEEKDFKDRFWKDVYVSYTQFFEITQTSSFATQHISKVDFNELNDDDLVRLFEFIILTRNDISERKVDATYFNYY